MHSTLAAVEDSLGSADSQDFRETDPAHLDACLKQIFYLTALIQVIDDLSLALHPIGETKEHPAEPNSTPFESSPNLANCP